MTMHASLIFLMAVVWLAGCSRKEGPPQSPTEAAASAMSVVNVADSKTKSQLLKGWHTVEQGAWRWTERQFSVALKAPSPGKAATLQLNFSLPEVLIQRLRSVTLTATVGGEALAAETYTQAGAHVYAQSVAGPALAGDVVRVDFSLDKALPPGEIDARELGVVVSSIRLD